MHSFCFLLSLMVCSCHFLQVLINYDHIFFEELHLDMLFRRAHLNCFFCTNTSLGPSLPEPAGRRKTKRRRKVRWFSCQISGWNHHLDLVLILRERNKQKNHGPILRNRILQTHTNLVKNPMLGLQWTLPATWCQRVNDHHLWGTCYLKLMSEMSKKLNHKVQNAFQSKNIPHVDSI